MRRILPRVACGGDDPAAHIYPFDDLHITVVTFSTTIDVPVDEVYTENRKKYCVGIVESRKRYGWEVRSNHCVGRVNGILTINATLFVEGRAGKDKCDTICVPHISKQI